MDQGFKPGELVLISSKPKIHLLAQGYRKVRPIKPRASTVVHHYEAINKIGFPTGFKCWCGATITFRYGEHDISHRRKQWFDQHDLCEPPKGGQG